MGENPSSCPFVKSYPLATHLILKTSILHSCHCHPIWLTSLGAMLFPLIRMVLSLLDIVVINTSCTLPRPQSALILVCQSACDVAFACVNFL